MATYGAENRRFQFPCPLCHGNSARRAIQSASGRRLLRALRRCPLQASSAVHVQSILSQRLAWISLVYVVQNVVPRSALGRRMAGCSQQRYNHLDCRAVVVVVVVVVVVAVVGDERVL